MKRKFKRSSGHTKILISAFFVFGIVLWLSPSARALDGKKETDGPPIGSSQVYKMVPAGTQLQTSSRFKVVDDFSGKKWENRLGGFWRLENANAGEVGIKRDKDKDQLRASGYGLKASFELRPQQFFKFYSSLEKIDMSQADFLAMKCKVKPAPKKAFNGRIRVALTDWSGKTVERDITSKCTESGEWGEAVLPIWLFKGVDLDQLSQISYTVVNNEEEPSQAVFWLDEIAFFGPELLGFESTRDNIKGFPETVLNEKVKEELLKTPNHKRFLRKIGRDTWRFFENVTDKKSDMILDHIKTGAFPMVGVYTSPTNIAMDLMCTVAALELGYLPRAKAEKRVKKTLETLGKLKKRQGFFYNFYETTRLSVSREFISSIDNAWLAASLMVVRQAFRGQIAEDASEILDGFNFHHFLDPENNHLAIGYDVEQDSLTAFHYGMLVTEARAMSFIAIGKGDIPRNHWWYLYRTAPDAWDWQTQKPKGKWVRRGSVEYFQGYYVLGKKKFVPSWGGSMFEFLMPTLVIPEKTLAPRGLGLNDRVATELHRSYALETKKYPVWGISPAAVSDGRRWQYGEYGVRNLGAKGYPDREVIAPYASFLALETLPREAIDNLRKLLQYDIYGEYGFYDSVYVRNGHVTKQYLVLDQGMSLIAIANYLNNGIIQKHFMRDPIAQNAKDLLTEETFF